MHIRWYVRFMLTSRSQVYILSRSRCAYTYRFYTFVMYMVYKINLLRNLCNSMHIGPVIPIRLADLPGCRTRIDMVMMRCEYPATSPNLSMNSLASRIYIFSRCLASKSVTSQWGWRQVQSCVIQPSQHQLENWLPRWFELDQWRECISASSPEGVIDGLRHVISERSVMALLGGFFWIL